MTLWYVLWLIRIVRLVENVVGWRRKLAGKLQKCAGSEPVRIGERGRIGFVNWPREFELDWNLSLEEAWREGRPFTWSWSGQGDRIGRIIGGQIGSTWRRRARIGSKHLGELARGKATRIRWQGGIGSEYVKKWGSGSEHWKEGHPTRPGGGHRPDPKWSIRPEPMKVMTTDPNRWRWWLPNRTEF